ncbi:MAG: hypothetical protein WA009_04945 [Phototrophicaceae bacterium]
MHLSYHFAPHEIETVRRIVADKLACGRRAVLHRLHHNVEGSVPVIDDDVLWNTHMMCLLTTQQRSGPGSAINRLLDRDPFPLSLSACRTELRTEADVVRVLTDAGGIRRTNRIAKAVVTNLRALERGEWDTMRRWRDRLAAQRAMAPDPLHRALEESAAGYMLRFLEFGPKQSRNFWQSLGLTRYAFVLDSRVLGWLRATLDIDPGLLASEGLSINGIYTFVSTMLLNLCDQAGVLPCMLDIALFDTYDEDSEWTERVLY